MDSVTVSIVYGINIPIFKIKTAFIIALFMGVFQGLMPILGWLSINIFNFNTKAFGYFIASVILFTLGSLMIYGFFKKDNSIKRIKPNNYKILTSLAFATSIDAFAVGISFNITNTSLYISSFIIGIITFILSFLAVYMAGKIKQITKLPLEIIGGIILIGIGIKTLLNH